MQINIFKGKRWVCILLTICVMLTMMTPFSIPVFSADYPVRLVQTGGLFLTLKEAIAAAESAGYNTFTLEVIGDMTESTGNVSITRNVTIVGAEGTHTVRPSGTGLSIVVNNGGSLTLGDDTTEGNFYQPNPDANIGIWPIVPIIIPSEPLPIEPLPSA